MDIEREVKRKIRTPYDFEFLGYADWEAYLASLATQTDIELLPILSEKLR